MGKKPKYFETKEFILEQKNWYLKLVDNGFNDAEKFIGGKLILAQTSTYPYRHQVSLEQKENKLNYYLLIEQKMNEEIFPSQRDHLIMFWTSQGLKIKDIVVGLRDKGYTTNRNLVTYIIRRYEYKWGIKYWTAQQMDPNLVTAF